MIRRPQSTLTSKEKKVERECKNCLGKACKTRRGHSHEDLVLDNPSDSTCESGTEGSVTKYD